MTGEGDLAESLGNIAKEVSRKFTCNQACAVSGTSGLCRVRLVLTGASGVCCVGLVLCQMR